MYSLQGTKGMVGHKAGGGEMAASGKPTGKSKVRSRGKKGSEPTPVEGTEGGDAEDDPLPASKASGKGAAAGKAKSLPKTTAHGAPAHSKGNGTMSREDKEDTSLGSSMPGLVESAEEGERSKADTEKQVLEQQVEAGQGEPLHYPVKRSKKVRKKVDPAATTA